jgi:hypothetical protein
MTYLKENSSKIQIFLNNICNILFFIWKIKKNSEIETSILKRHHWMIFQSLRKVSLLTNIERILFIVMISKLSLISNSLFRKNIGIIRKQNNGLIKRWYCVTFMNNCCHAIHDSFWVVNYLLLIVHKS